MGDRDALALDAARRLAPQPVTAYFLRRAGYDGFDQITEPALTPRGTVREIRSLGRPRVLLLRRASGRRSWEWALELRLRCDHTKLVSARRVTCWTTHARCGKCRRAPP